MKYHRIVSTIFKAKSHLISLRGESSKLLDAAGGRKLDFSPSFLRSRLLAAAPKLDVFIETKVQ